MRVLTFTYLFPNTIQPDFGGFVARRMEAWAAKYARRWAVIAPVPFFPRFPIKTRWSEFSKIPLEEFRSRCRVFHPRYFMLPKVGGYFQGTSVATGSLKVIKRLWKEEGPFDLIDAHFVYPDGYAALKLARRFGVPVVVTARGTDVNLYPDLPIIGSMVRTVLRKATALIAVSGALRERMVTLGAKPENCHLIPNGVDLEHFRHDNNAYGNGLEILTAGNLVPGKGMDVIIQAVAGLRARGTLVELCIAGDGPDRERLARLANTLGVSKYVRILGRVPHDRMPALYAEADVFCLASRAEGCPNVVLEALASGLPVVATPVGGIPELIHDGTNGFLSIGLDAGSLADALLKSLDKTWNKDLIRRDLKGRTWDATADSVNKVFEQITTDWKTGFNVT